MYNPSHFREERHEVLVGLIRENPLAALVCAGEDGLIANHVPLLFAATDTAQGVLRGHVARENPQWKAFASGAEALAIFQGPQSYVSPSFYPTKVEHGKVVPTWNYAVVHAYGPAEVYDDPIRLRAFLERLTNQQESGRYAPWAVADAPADYIETLLGRIVGIEMRITRMEGKWKVSQNQPRRNAEGAAEGMGGAMGELIRERLNPGNPAGNKGL